MGVTERIKKRGYWQKGLYDLISDFYNNWTGALGQMDDDTGITLETYEANGAVTDPTVSGTKYSDHGMDIRANGIYLGDLVSICKQLRTNFNTIMDQAAADGGITGTTAYTDLKFGTTDYVIDDGNAKVKALGANQGDLVEFLDQWLDAFNAFLSVLDEDATVTDVDYRENWGIGDQIIIVSSSSSQIGRAHV